MKLVIGDRNYSSWSMRPWLLLTHFNIPFSEERVELFAPGYRDRLRVLSPSGKVPVLIDGDLVIWEALAICEYLSECYLQGAGWPAEVRARATCRAYCAEMHAGFSALRGEMPMNIRARRLVEQSEQLRSEVARIDQLWQQALQRYGGPCLFGEASIADFMYAPVVMRFQTYSVDLSDNSSTYCEHIKRLPAVQRWCDAAAVESRIVPQGEVGRPR